MGTNVPATSSEAVTGTSPSTVVLENPVGVTVPAAVSYNATTRVVTLNLNADLANDNTRYTVTLKGGANAIRDTQGAALVTTS